MIRASPVGVEQALVVGQPSKFGNQQAVVLHREQERPLLPKKVLDAHNTPPEPLGLDK